MKRVAESWQAFELIVIPKQANAMQRRAMRRAFYVGFLQALLAVQDAAIESDGDANLYAEMIQRLHDECDAFANDVAVDRA